MTSKSYGYCSAKNTLQLKNGIFAENSKICFHHVADRCDRSNQLKRDRTIRWSSESRQLAFSLKVDSSKTALYTLDRSTLKNLTPPLNAESIEGITWSPNSRQLSFAAGAVNENNLYVINRDGSGLNQLTHSASISNPVWQP